MIALNQWILASFAPCETPTGEFPSISINPMPSYFTQTSIAQATVDSQPNERMIQ
jgi:hypothetical protein